MIIVLLIVSYLLHQKFVFNRNLVHKRTATDCEYSTLSQEQEELLDADAAECIQKFETKI